MPQPVGADNPDDTVRRRGYGQRVPHSHRKIQLTRSTLQQLIEIASELAIASGRSDSKGSSSVELEGGSIRIEVRDHEEADSDLVGVKRWTTRSVELRSERGVVLRARRIVAGSDEFQGYFGNRVESLIEDEWTVEYCSLSDEEVARILDLVSA